jgi:hypothetical protein
MSYVPRGDAAGAATWSDLVDELDRWGESGRVAALWWRDDDAVTATACLAELLALAAGVPLGLAVIPGLARPDLAAMLQAAPNVMVLQHGWLHLNRMRDGKKSEYPEHRGLPEVAAEIGAGRTRLNALFGARALPVFVPPWNRMAALLHPALRKAGIRVLSGMASRKSTMLSDGVMPLDVHVDMTAWRRDRRFVGTEAALGAIVARLRQARQEEPEAAVPLGILTHHLIMDRPTHLFVERLLRQWREHAAACLISAAEAVGL